MKKINIFKRLLALSLIILLIFTSNVLVVSSYGIEDFENITISPDAQVNIYNSNNENIEQTTQTQAEIVTEPIKPTDSVEVITSASLNISNGHIYLRDDGTNTQYSRDNATWTNYIDKVNIFGVGASSITVLSGSHNINFDNIIIETNGVCAFDIQGTSYVKLTLSENSVNEVDSGLSRSSGIQVHPNATLEIGSETVETGPDGNSITSSGVLKAFAGDYGGAGIGCDGTVIIGNYTVIAQGGSLSPGIGNSFGGLGANITIKDVAKVTATGGSFSAGIGNGKKGGDCNITISGGEVKAYGGHFGAGIGSGSDIESNITTNISGGTVEAYGGDNGAGIGGGFNSIGGNITISGNAQVVSTGGNATENYIYPSAIGSGGYRVDATKPNGANISIGQNAQVTAVAQSGNFAIDSQNEITAPSGETVANILQFNYDTLRVGTIALEENNTSQFEYNSVDGYTSIAFSHVDNTKTYTLKLNDVQQMAKNSNGTYVNDFVYSSGITVYNETTNGGFDVALDVSKENIYLSEFNGDTAYRYESGDWEYYIGNITIIGETTQNTVTVLSGTHNIILDDVNISLLNENQCAFDIQGSAKVNLTLAKDSENILKSGKHKAGLQVSDNATLEISSENVTGEEKTGKLTATGGVNGAGIGGSTSGTGGTITINSGEIIATSEQYGAGIGGGYYTSAGNITINGGKVTATSMDGGAGIGGGEAKDGGNIVINGGEVIATSMFYGAGIGGGYGGSGGNITISGGIVETKGGQDGAGIGGGRNGIGGNITISGNAQVASTGGNATESYIYPSAIGSGGYRVDATKPNGANISIGQNAQVMAIAQGDGILIDDIDGTINAPSGEQVANIVELNFEDTVYQNRKITLSNSTHEISTTAKTNFKNIAIAGLQKDAQYKFYVNDKAKQGVKAGETDYTTNFKADENYVVYNNLDDTLSYVSANIYVSSVVLKSNGDDKLIKYNSDEFKVYTGSATITGTTTQHTITVESGTHNITLNNANIYVANTLNVCAFDIQGTASVNVMLTAESENVFESGTNKAGVQVGADASINISSISTSTTGSDGETVIKVGTIIAEGGNGGAGIGGSNTVTAGNITISNGEVIATGGDLGAGIGGGYLGSGGNITINGSAQVVSYGGYLAAGIGGGNSGNGGNITISGNAQVGVASGGYATGIGGGYNGDGGNISIGENTKVAVVAIDDSILIDDIDGVITAPQGEVLANIMEFYFQEPVSKMAQINLMQNGDSQYPININEEIAKVAYVGLEANTDYQLEIQEVGQQSPTIIKGIIEGEEQIVDIFNTADRQITKVEEVDKVITYFMITNEMLLNGWADYENDLVAISGSQTEYSIGDGLEVVQLSKEELTAFGKNYSLDGVLIKAELPYSYDILFYLESQKNGDSRYWSPAMKANDVYNKVIYISDFENYDSYDYNFGGLDKKELVKNLTYEVTIDYPNLNGVDGQNLITDTVYIGTEVRQFAIADSRYYTYMFNAFDNESTKLDRNITLTATQNPKTYKLNLPVETLGSSYPNLYSNATLEALADTLIYAISIDNKNTTYEVYFNSALGQYTADVSYGKAVWIKAPQTVASGHFVGWYNIDEQKFVSDENEFKFVITQNTSLVPIYSDNTEVVLSQTPYALSEEALYETYTDSFGVAKIRYTTPITYFPNNVDGVSLKVRYQVAFNDESYDLNAPWTETDLTNSVNKQNRVNFYLTADYYNKGSYNEMTIYVQPYVEYNNGTEIVDTKLDVKSIATLKYEYPVY